MRTLIIQTAFIGDVVLCSSMIEALTKEEHSVGFVVKPEAANILEHDPRIFKLHVFDKRGKDSGITGLLSTSKKIRTGKYDAALVPQRSLRSAALARYARIPVRIGFSNSAGSWLFTHKIAYSKTAHEIVRNHALLEPVGITNAPSAPSIAVTQEDINVAADFFKNCGIENNNIVIGFGPGSKWFTKQWGAERYRKLAELIIKNTDCKVVCFGGKDEKELGSAICGAHSNTVYNAIGLFSLRESAAALKKMSVAVTNDNGLMHLAAAAGTPVVAVFGPTVPEFGFAPWGDNHTILSRNLYCRPCSIHGTKSCPEKHFRCMKEIEPEDVFNAVKKYISL